MALKRLKSFLLFICFLLLFCSNIKAQATKQDTMAFVIVDGKYFIIDINGKYVFKNGYQSIGKVPESDYYMVRSNNRYGLIDGNEEVILPTVFQKIHIDKDLFIVVTADSNIAFISKENKTLLILNGNDYQLSILDSYFSEKMLPIKYKDKWGFINKKGKNVIRFEYDEVEIFRNGYAIVGKRNNQEMKYGLIDKKNRIVIPIIYDVLIHDLNKNYIVAKKKPGENKYLTGYNYGLINSDNKITIPILYDSLRYNTDADPYGKPLHYRVYSKNTGWKIIDSLNNEKACCYENVGTLTNLYLEAKKEKWGLIDTEGKETFPFIYDKIEIVDTNIIAVNRNNKWAFSKPDGTHLTDFVFDEISYYKHGLSLVKREDKYQFVDVNGAILMDNVPTEWFNERNLYRKLNPVQSPKVFTYYSEGKFGLMDLNGSILFPAISEHHIWFR